MPLNQTKHESSWTVFLIFLRLGLTSFGGPIAHLAYFREEFVNRRQWLSDERYSDLVALCQFLPGPASSQVGLAIGLQRSGYTGAFAAWTGFTMPSAIALIAFALSISQYNELIPPGILSGLKIVVVAVVAQAVWGMAKSLCPDVARRVIMLLCAALLVFIPSPLTQVIVIAIGGILGWLLYRGKEPSYSTDCSRTIKQHNSYTAALLWLLVFVALLIALPIMTQTHNNQTLNLFDAFYRSGSMVFGGGHVVLPLLQAEIVDTALMTNDVFLAGYGATQAMPGPLFTFAAFLGASILQSPSGVLVGLLCLVAVFLPSFLLVFGVLPFWDRLRSNQSVQAALLGINASVVGILLAALYHPIWSTTIIQWSDLLLATMAFLALIKLKASPWIVVVCSAFLGWLMY